MMKTRTRVAVAVLDSLLGAVRTTGERFARDERGTTAVEYGLIATLIAVACIAAFKQLGGNSAGSWGYTANVAAGAMK